MHHPPPSPLSQGQNTCNQVIGRQVHKRSENCPSTYILYPEHMHMPIPVVCMIGIAIGLDMIDTKINQIAHRMNVLQISGITYPYDIAI